MRAPAPEPARRAVVVRAVLVAALLAAAPHAARAAPPQSGKADAAALLGEIEQLGHESVTLAARLRDSEATVAALEERIAALAAAEAAKAAALRARQIQHNETVAGLLRIARIPEAALLASPQSPTETVRGAILMRAALGQIEHDAAALRSALADLGRVREEIAAKKTALVNENERLRQVRDRLAALVAAKTALQRGNPDVQARTAQLSAVATEARDLRELLERLGLTRAEPGQDIAPAEAVPDAAAVPAPAAAPPAAVASLPPPRSGLPANGRIVRRFGDADREGVVARGLTIETVAKAQVVSPRAGEIVFAGPFRGFGQLLIIQHEDGYHTLLSGFSRIDCAVGSRVLAGEPVGAMGDETDERPVLYVELRLNGRPINPLPWLTAGTSKVSG